MGRALNSQVCGKDMGFPGAYGSISQQQFQVNLLFLGPLLHTELGP